MAEEAKEEKTMDMRLLGNSGLKVSVFGFGFWGTYGVKEGVERCVSVMRIARNGGINFFDNAEAYGKNRGDAEIIMGQAIKQLQEEDPVKWRRTDLVISTKIFWGGDGVNEKGLSRKHLFEATDACLKRLQLDYVDVMFCHRPDELTPTEEVVRAYSDLIASGKIMYWGTSEWSAQRITEAFWIAKTYGLVAPIVEQPQYNMFHRERFESEYRRLYEYPYRMGTTIWSPLASGVLTGKYNKDIPKGSRMDHESMKWLKDRFEKEKAEKIPKVQKLMEYAEEKFQTTVTCLALAWCAMNKNVSTVILGATKEHQIEQNLEALAVAAKMTPEHMAEIDEILGNKQADLNLWGRQFDNKINPV